MLKRIYKTFFIKGPIFKKTYFYSTKSDFFYVKNLVKDIYFFTDTSTTRAKDKDNNGGKDAQAPLAQTATDATSVGQDDADPINDAFWDSFPQQLQPTRISQKHVQFSDNTSDSPTPATVTETRAPKATGTDSIPVPTTVTSDPLISPPVTRQTLTQASKNFFNDSKIREKQIHQFTKEELEFFKHAMLEKQKGEWPKINRGPKHSAGIQLNDKNQLEEIIPVLKEMEFVPVKDKDGNEHHIVMIGAGETCIIAKEKKTIAPEVKQLAGDLAMQTYELPSPHPGKKPLPYVKIATKFVKDIAKSSEELILGMWQYEEDQRLKDPTDALRFETFSASCDCNRPDVGKKRAMIKCAICKTPAHTICTKGQSNYTCATCTIDIDGLTWAAGKDMSNTCPVDNTISHLALRASKDEGFKEEMQKCSNSNSKPVKAFGESVLHASKNESASSHKKWHNVLADSNNLDADGSWYGGTDDRLYNILDENLPQFRQNIKQPCNGQCTVTKEPTEPIAVNEVPILLTTRPRQHLLNDSPLFAEHKVDCHHQGCKGQTTFGPMEIPSGERDPLYLVVRNHGALNGPEDFKEDLPKHVIISGTKYQLGMINMWDKSRGHYTSLHNVDDSFVYYDGMSKTKKKFRRAFPTDYKQETIYVDHVLYVKMCNNKKI